MFKFTHIFMFYTLSILSIFFSIATIYTNKTLRAAIFLCIFMIINSGFYLLLGAEFLAVVQMLVYVSGIVVLLIFVIMLTDTLQNEDVDVNTSRKLISIIISSVFFLINVFAIVFVFPDNNDYIINLTVYEESNLANIGFKLLDIGYSGYVIPFEIISLLLLTSLVGCLKISRK